MVSKIFGFGSVCVCAAIFSGSVARADIGFEFESNKNTFAFQFAGQPLSQTQLWANCQNATLNNTKAPYKKPIVEGNTFTVEADELTDRFSDMEIVVHGSFSKTGFPFDENSKQELIDTLKEVTEIYKRMQIYATAAGNSPRACVLAKALSPSGGVDDRFVMIDRPSSFSTTLVAVQATLGIRLDQLHRFMQENGEQQPSEGSVDFSARKDGKNFLFPESAAGGFSAYNIGDAANRASVAVDNFIASIPTGAAATFPSNNSQATAALRGLVAIAALYLRGTDIKEEGGLVKNITPIMARTDFAKMFSLLPKAQRDYFVENKTLWSDLVLRAAGMRKDLPKIDQGNDPLFRRHQYLRGLGTKREWLEAMVGKKSLGSYKLGKDLLTAKNTPMKNFSGDYWLDTLGGLGSKTDSVLGDPLVREAPIFELRSLKGTTPDRLKGFALDLFEYAKNLEQGNRTRFSPQNYNGPTGW